MARASFAGSDLGNFFADLYRQDQQQATSDARYQQQVMAQQAQEAKYAQQASDADTLDQWRNGMISDEQWIAYIEDRVAATAGDPKENQKWTKTLRQYQTQIADNKAQFAFENGESTIADLIAYHEGVLAKMDPDSQEYRERVLVVNGLVDNSLAENINSGSQAILDKIDDGQATYRDLLKFYKDAKAQARTGSALADNIDQEIAKVTKQVEDVEYAARVGKAQFDYESGKLSPTAYAKFLRKEATKFQNSDPGKYYQILQAANDLEQQAKKGTSGGGGGGGGGTKKTTPSQTRKNAIEQQKAVVANSLAINDIYESGGTRYIDVNGKEQTLTLNDVRANDRALLNQWDKLAALLNADDNPDEAQNVLRRKENYIVEKVQPHNTVPFAEQIDTLMTSAATRFALATNVDQEVKTSSELRANLRRVIQQAEDTTQNVGTRYYGVNKNIIEDPDVISTGKKGRLDLPTQEALDTAKGMLRDLTILSNPGASDEEIAAAQSRLKNTGNPDDSGFNVMDYVGKHTAEAPRVQEGLRTGTKVIYTKNGQWGVADVVPKTGKPVIDPQTGRPVQATTWEPDIEYDPDTQTLVRIFVDDRGVPTVRWAVAEKVVPEFGEGWNIKSTNDLLKKGGKALPKGSLVPTSIWNNLTSDEQKLLISSGAVERVAVDEWNQVTIPGYTDKNGKKVGPRTYTQDPGTKKWYPGETPPLRGIVSAGDGSIYVNDDGSVRTIWEGLAHTGEVFFPYAGENTRAMDQTIQALRTNNPEAFAEFGARDMRGELVLPGDPRYNLLEDWATPDYTPRASRGGVMPRTGDAKSAAKASIKAAQQGYAQGSRFAAERTEQRRGEDEQFALADTFSERALTRIATTAESLGIKTGITSRPSYGGDIPYVLKTPPKPSQSTVKPIGQPGDYSSTSYAATTTPQLPPLISAATGFKISMPKPTLTTRTYTGTSVKPTTVAPTKPKSTPKPSTTSAPKPAVTPPTTAERKAESSAKQQAGATKKAVAF